MRAGLRVFVLAMPAFVCAGSLVHPLPAAAQATNFRQELDDIKNAIPGLGETRGPIDFTERAPLVVPPTNDLPPPIVAPPQLGLNDPDALERSKALSDPRRPVPPIDPGAGATGLDARAYLIDPPSGMRNPAAVASEATSDGFTDAPKRKKGTQAAAGTKHRVHRTPDVAAAQ